MFEVAVEQSFAAAHALRDYQGKCERLHGHNYRVRVIVQGEQLNPSGLLVDFLDLRRILHEVIEPFDHRVLNEVPPFDRVNPTAEELARYLCQQVSQRLQSLRADGVSVKEVQVWETDSAVAVYRP